jgi:hypothetical protein
VTYRPVSLHLWCKLEEKLLSRFGRKKGDAALRAIRKWPGWHWPTERECLDTIRPMNQRRATVYRAQARAELPAMLALPSPTPPDQIPALEERARFGLDVQIIRPADRCLSPHHAMAILPTISLPMLVAISKIIGGRWLVPFVELQRQAEQRDDEDAVLLLRLEDDRLAASRQDQQRGPRVAAVRT